MKKSANADIRNLFRKFGGDTGSYQEIQQDYVVDNAQKSWPIVAAMEKERVSAPTLRASVGGIRVPSSSGSAAGSFLAAQPAAPVARRVAPVAVHDSQLEERAASVLFNKPAAAPVAAQSSALLAALKGSAKPSVSPVRSLFATTNGAAAKPLDPPVRSLFSVQNVAAKPAQAESFRPVSVQVRRSEMDPLASVFSRLLNPQGAVASPDKSLRSLFGFIKK